jgi:hypothetical protein
VVGREGDEVDQGAREIVAWHDEDPARRVIDERVDALMDELVARYGQRRTAAAKARVAHP